MRFTRKNAQQQSPPLLSSADVSATFADDFFRNPSSPVAENSTQDVFSSSPFHTPPSSPIPSGDSPFKTNKRQDEGRAASDDTIEPSLSTARSQSNSSPVTCLAAAKTSGGKDTWTEVDHEIKLVLPTVEGVVMPSDDQMHHTVAIKKPPCVCIVESPVYKRGVSEPYMDSAEEQGTAMEDKKRYRSSPALESTRGSSSQGLEANRNCTRRQSRIRFWTRLPSRKQKPSFKKTDPQTPHPSGFTPTKSGDGTESAMSSLYVRDKDGRGEIRDDDESIRRKTFGVCNDVNDETTTAEEIRFHSHCIGNHTHGTGKSRKSARQSAGETLSRTRRRTSFLGRLSERNPFSKRSGITPSGDEPRTKNDSSVSRQLDLRSPRMARGRSGRLMTFINKLRDRTPDGYFKAGVFDFDCDGKTALQEVKTLLERQYLGVLISEQFREMRMRVPLTTAGRFCVLNVIVVVEPQSGGNSRVSLRRGFGDVLSVRSEDFDWFCFDVYRTLVRNRAVVRPYYA